MCVCVCVCEREREREAQGCLGARRLCEERARGVARVWRVGGESGGVVGGGAARGHFRRQISQMCARVCRACASAKTEESDMCHIYELYEL